MNAFGFELRQAARSIFTWKQTGAILIPAIGLALATIMFAVGWGYSSLSLPFKDADRVVKVGYLSPGTAEDYSGLSGDYQPFYDWKERKDVFTDVAASRRMTDLWMSMTVKSDKGSVVLDVREVTTNFFDVLGLSFPGIQAWKEAANVKSPKTVVFTHKTGVNKFGYESMGKLFPAQEEGHGVIPAGILPRNFVLPIIDGRDDSEWAFTPIELRPGDHGAITESTRTGGTVSSFDRNPLTVFARLAPGVTPQLAEQMLAGASGVYTEAAGMKARLDIRPIRDIITRSSKPIVRYSWALCALILVLCAANLGGILLARCTYRLREYALRTALGASLSNLIRTLLLELCGIAVIAALIAAFIARAAMPVIAYRVPIKLEAFGRPIFGQEAVIFLIAATAAVMFASAVPAIVVLIRNYYKGFSQGILAVFRSYRAMRITLTVSQTAIVTLLLCLSWMTVRGYSDIFFRDTGVDTSVRVISVLYPSLKATYSAGQPPPFNVIETLDILRGGNPDSRIALSTVTRFDLFNDRRPLAWHLNFEKTTMMEENASFSVLHVAPGFLKTLGVKIIAGRDFNDSDLSRRELIVNEAFVRKMGWSPHEAVGRETAFQGGGSNLGVIIGVCGDFLTGSWDSELLPEIYTSIDRSRGVRTDFPIRYFAHPDDLRRAGSIEKAIRSFDPDATVVRNAGWGEMLGETVRGRSFATLCIVIFTLAGIAIVVTGITSVVMFIVERRTRDIAIQAALGAPPIRVCWFVMKDMAIAGIAGAFIGGIASWWAGKAVAHYVYNGEKYQNLTGLAIATVIMLAIIAVAALLPALRALRIEPGRAMNME